MLLSTLIFLRQVIKMSCCATRFRFFRPFVCRHCRGFSGHSQLAKVGRFSTPPVVERVDIQNVKWVGIGWSDDQRGTIGEWRKDWSVDQEQDGEVWVEVEVVLRGGLEALSSHGVSPGKLQKTGELCKVLKLGIPRKTDLVFFTHCANGQWPVSEGSFSPRVNSQYSSLHSLGMVVFVMSLYFLLYFCWENIPHLHLAWHC